MFSDRMLIGIIIGVCSTMIVVHTSFLLSPERIVSACSNQDMVHINVDTYEVFNEQSTYKIKFDSFKEAEIFFESQTAMDVEEYQYWLKKRKSL